MRHQISLHLDSISSALHLSHLILNGKRNALWLCKINNYDTETNSLWFLSLTVNSRCLDYEEYVDMCVEDMKIMSTSINTYIISAHFLARKLSGLLLSSLDVFVLAAFRQNNKPTAGYRRQLCRVLPLMQ